MTPYKTACSFRKPQVRLVVLVWFAFLCALVAGATVRTSADEPAHVVQVQMRNVNYHFSDTLSVHINSLRGELVPAGKNEFPILDDQSSYTIRITAGEMTCPVDSLAKILNSYVFANHDSPLKDVSTSIDKGRLKIKGKLHDKGDVPFETAGTLRPTADGKIRIHMEKIKALHLPVKGLMDTLGIKLSALIKSGKMPGIAADGDDLITDLAEVLPPPHIEGAVTSIRIEGQNIIEVIGDPAKTPFKRVAATNYMAYWGNQLGFGKLIMTDTDMTLIDMNPDDPFDFDLDHYKDQLVPGYAKITANFGLRVFMKDFNKVQRTSPPRTEAKH
jgi:hypothetical protein